VKAKGDAVDATDIVYKALSPAIRFTLAECVDIPPTVFVDRYVPLTKGQQEAYNQMRDALVVEAKEGLITAANAGVKASKLRQIATGCVYGPDGKVAKFDAKPRLEECLKLVQDAESGKALVFVPFTAALHSVAEFLQQHGRLVSVVYGDVSKAERDRIFGEFQNGFGTDVIVCHPKVMAHSLTLTAASMSIWFAPYDQPGIYEQANCRTPRPGQKLTTVIANIGGTPIEKLMYQRLKTKQNVQNALLDMIREGRE
jgi:SNF2 family DNA or RNA helicase